MLIVPKGKDCDFSCPHCKVGYKVTALEKEMLPLSMVCQKCGEGFHAKIDNNEKVALYERLKTASPEQWASFFGTKRGMNLCCHDKEFGLCLAQQDCYHCWLDFLKSEV